MCVEPSYILGKLTHRFEAMIGFHRLDATSRLQDSFGTFVGLRVAIRLSFLKQCRRKCRKTECKYQRLRSRNAGQ